MLNELASTLNGVLWSPILVYMAIGVGLFLSIGLKFPQFRLIKDMVSQLMKGSSSDNGVSSFQGFAMALGGRVGTGNIAGVASAIGVGGPGAVFWMWVIALVGAGSAFTESTLAQTYKGKVVGEYRGGPAYYIEKGLKCKPLAIVFALATILAMTITGPTVQANAISTAFKGLNYNISPVVVGVVVAALFLIVTIGGIKRIGTFASYVVPIMAGIYLLLAVVILIANAAQVPAMFALIFKSAFGLEPVFGAVFGYTIMQGVKRGIYSNEAGWGSGAHAAATAEVSHPAKQGLAQAFSVYIDTLLVCTATALMMLSTGMYNVVTDAGKAVYEGVPGVEAGPGYVQAAIDTLINGLGAPFITIAMFFFAFTTLLSFAIYADANIQYILGATSDKVKKYAYFAGCIVIALLAFTASFKDMTTAWNYADVGVGICCWLNFPVLLLMSKKSFKLLKDYEIQKKMGLDPVFIPEDVGFENCELWDEIVDEHYADLKAAKRAKISEEEELEIVS
ncbi:alanine/glycine:cation symporter family protein [Aminicella lysinilytica]|uniref:AGCS family alanine or glycine:cation symporter n=1 Tax=Aminicella lysinilytica TaxID=433323 RepID=A0A4R6Q0V8_9FIRM|nr:alanine/glycine:cation symporter family protein [Aminicella lysinilytica]TDP52418.1 AGCS family alanine or glycine:cation symporter [Aminicella lysinilytica]